MHVFGMPLYHLTIVVLKLTSPPRDAAGGNSTKRKTNLYKDNQSKACCQSSIATSKTSKAMSMFGQSGYQKGSENLPRPAQCFRQFHRHLPMGRLLEAEHIGVMMVMVMVMVMMMMMMVMIHIQYEFMGSCWIFLSTRMIFFHTKEIKRAPASWGIEFLSLETNVEPPIEWGSCNSKYTNQALSSSSL